tara:strand:+ start:1307 stop:1840 length:534 start_codon:yes stop_codon:yes gene_type:complete
MSTQTAKGSGSTVNDGGTVVAGGTASKLTKVIHGQEVNRSTKPQVASADLQKSISAGTFAFDDSGTGIVAKKVNATLSGAANTFLRSGAATTADGPIRAKVHKIEGLTSLKLTTALRAGEYNHVTNKFDGGKPTTSSDSFGTDDAVTSNELQYMYGNPVPASGAYGADNTTSLVDAS